MRGRTVLLVVRAHSFYLHISAAEFGFVQTHNVAMAAPIADFVISLHDGHIVSQGSVRDALAKDKALAEELKHEEEAMELDEHEEAEASGSDDPAAPGEPTKAKEGKLVVAEEIEVGHVSWKACAYFRRMSLKMLTHCAQSRCSCLAWLVDGQYSSGPTIF